MLAIGRFLCFPTCRKGGFFSVYEDMNTRTLQEWAPLPSKEQGRAQVLYGHGRQALKWTDTLSSPGKGSGLPASVNSLMIEKVCFLCKTFAAVPAHKRFFPCVGSVVYDQMRLVLEELPAQRTEEGFLARVNSLVLREV